MYKSCVTSDEPTINYFISTPGQLPNGPVLTLDVACPNSYRGKQCLGGRLVNQLKPSRR